MKRGGEFPFRDVEGTRPFHHLAEEFRSVEVKYFKQIFKGTFRTKDLVKLAHTYSSLSEDKDVRGILHLLHCFDVYMLAVYKQLSSSKTCSKLQSNAKMFKLWKCSGLPGLSFLERS